MHAVSRFGPSVPAATIITLALFFLMQSLIGGDPRLIPEEKPIKPVPFFTAAKPADPPPPVTPERPPIIENPGIPTVPHAPETDKTPKVISNFRSIPTDPEVTSSNMGNSEPFKFVEAPTQYPTSALIRNIEGYAVVEFTVAPDGSVRDAVLIEETPEGYGFGRAALQAIVKFKYQARVVDGQALAASGVRERFIFELED